MNAQVWIWIVIGIAFFAAVIYVLWSDEHDWPLPEDWELDDDDPWEP